jgi:hypothetical protein
MVLELSLVFKLTDGIPTLEDFINDLVNAYVLDLKNCDTESQSWMKQIFPWLATSHAVRTMAYFAFVSFRVICCICFPHSCVLYPICNFVKGETNVSHL